MTDQTVGYLAIILLLTMVILRIPVAVALCLAGFLGNAILQGVEPAIIQFQLIIWEVSDNFVLITLPLFILMGQLASEFSFGKDIYAGFNKWFGRTPGGLAVTSIVSSAGFGSVTGSSVATVTSMGSMLMPEMRRYRYAPSLAAGSLASGGVLAILIPPSVPLVFYGAWTETSIGDLFLAGVLPGLLLTALFVAFVLMYSFFNPSSVPRGRAYSWGEKLRSSWHLLPMVAVWLFVLASIYSGIATPTEAAALGVAGILVIAVVFGRITWRTLHMAFSQSGLMTSNIFLLLLGGVFFSRFMAQTDITRELIAAIGALDLAPVLVVALLVLLYLVLGAVLDTFGMILLTLPFVFPLITSLGYDPVWFGIFLVLMIELSLITPPIGINVFVLQRVAPDIPLLTIFRGTFPFVLITLLTVAILVAYPQLALWLPAQAK